MNSIKTFIKKKKMFGRIERKKVYFFNFSNMEQIKSLPYGVDNNLVWPY